MIDRDLASVLSPHTWLCLYLLGSWTCATASEWNIETAVHELHIPRQSRIKTLNELKQLHKLQLDYRSGHAEEREAEVGPIDGELMYGDALERVLRNSTLSYRIESNELIIETRSSTITTEKSITQSSAPSTKAAPPVVPPPTGAPEEMVVLSNPLPIQPITVLERRDLTALGVSSVSEALRYISQSTFARPEGYQVSGAQYADLRGLGSNNTLVLINGRRAMPSAASLTANAFDLNTIPITAVERVELIVDSTAVAYGTDAAGGIINVLLRREVTDPTVEIQYGGAAGGAEQRRGTLHLGTESERFSGAVTVDYFDGGGLLGAERDLWRNQRFLGEQNLRALLSAAGNITSTDGRNLPGLSSPVAAVPIVDTTPGITLDDFVATAGTPNQDNLLRFYSIVPESKRKSVLANGTYNISESLRLSTELLYAGHSSRFFLCPPALLGLPVPTSNPFSPFDATVRSFRLMPELGSQSQSVDAELIRAVAALQGHWGEWEWNISALYSRETAITWMDRTLDLSPDGPVVQALATDNPERALNPFQAGAIGKAQLLSELIVPRQIDRFISGALQAISHAEGPLARTAAGPIALMLGAEWRQESGVFDSKPLGWFDRDRDIISLYLQLQVPIVGKDTARPGLHQLYLATGSRLDHYDGMSNVIRPQYGVVWYPWPALKMRVFRGYSFKPPSFYELYQPKTTTLGTVPDPAHDNELKTITTLVGGNDTLEAQTSETLTAGVTFSPESFAGAFISIDYWRVGLDGRVSTLSPTVLVENESLFRERITRSYDGGELLSVDASRINAGRLEASGIDLTLHAELPTDSGHFTPELRTTWFASYRDNDVPGRPAVERVNLASESGSILKWRAIASIKWARGPYGIAAAARYTPPYDDAVAGVRTGKRLASRTLFDLQGSIDLGARFGEDSAWNRVSLVAGVFNIFNSQPNVAEVGGAAAFDSSQGDLKNRSFQIRVLKRL
jgi:iron complex outermembrane receptor protein